MRALFVIASLLVAAPALAQPPASSLTLASGAAPSERVIIDGAAWRCDGAACTATGGADQPATRACRRVVAKLGKVTAFTWKGAALSPEQLAACNA